MIISSTGSANDVKKPPVTKGGSIPEPTEGELSTQPGSHIKIHATGEIEVLERKRVSAEDKELIAALGDKPRKGRNQNVAKGKTPVKKEDVKKVEKVENSAEDEEDDDDDMEEEQEIDEDEMDEEEDAAAEEDSVEEEMSEGDEEDDDDE